MWSQVIAEMMKEVRRLLSFQQHTTPPYHQIYYDQMERFHATMEQMQQRLCAERPKDWDKYLTAFLFAIRDVSQESLGFSPFKLLHTDAVSEVPWQI